MNSFDERFFQAIFQFANKIFFLDTVGIFLADGVLYILIVLAVFFVLLQRTWRAKIFLLLELFLACLLARGLVVEFIRFFYPKLRPFEFYGFEPLVSASGNAFPSGHATALFSIAMVIFLFNRRWGGWFLVLATISSMARVFVGVHWPFDILGGAILGVGAAFLVQFLLKDQRAKIWPSRDMKDGDYSI